MVALLAGKGLALGTGKPLVAVNHLEGHALSPRLVDPDLDFPYLLLLVSGGHCQLLEVRGGRRVSPACDDHRRCRRRGFRQGRQAARPALSRRAGDRSARGRGRRAAPCLCPGPWSARASRISPSPASRARCSARSLPASTAPADIAASLPAGGGRLPGRPHPPRASALAMRRRWSSPAELRPTAPSGPRCSRLAAGEGRPVQRAARLAVHGQCGDDRLGRGRALRARADRCARRAGAGALAARPGGGEGARSGGEGMSFERLGVIGGGAWGTALAQVAASGGARRPAVGARA